MKVVLIGGIFTVVAAIIGGFFVLHSTASVQPISSTSSNYPPVATQAAQSSYPNIQGTYSMFFHSAVSGFSSQLL